MKLRVVDNGSTVLRSCQPLLEPDGRKVYPASRPFTPAKLLDAIHKAIERQGSHD